MNDDYFDLEALRHSVQSAENQRTVSAITQRMQQSKDLLSGWSRGAWDSWAYWSGNHFSRWVPGLEQFSDTPYEYADQIRVSLNYVRQAVEALVSKLTAHEPGWDVCPGTSDESDADAARASEKLLEHFYRECRIRQKIPQMTRWGITAGLGVLRVDWDPLGGDPVPARDDSGVVLRGPDGRAIMVPSGVPRVVVCSPMAVFFDHGAVEPDLSDCRWVLEMAFVHIDEIREQWPEAGAMVSPSAPSTPDPLTMSSLGYQAMQGAEVERALVMRYYERPSARHPKGRYVACTDAVLLEERDGLAMGGELPYVVFAVNPQPGRLHGQGVVEDLKPINATINRQLSKRLELIDLHANPKWAVEEGSVRKEQFTNEAGEIIRFSRGSRRPEMIPPPVLSPEHGRMVDEMIVHMSAVSGVSELTQGSAPASMSGRMAQFMAEMESAKLAPKSADLEFAVARLGTLILRLCHEYLPAESTIRVLGEDGRLQAMQFYQSQLRSTNVILESGSMQLKHPSVQREAVMAAFERNIMGDRADPEVQRHARVLMEFGGDKFLNGDRTKDREYQMEENYAIMQGMRPEVMPNEDHATHIATMKPWMASVEFRNLLGDQQSVALQHLATHEAHKAMAAGGQPWWVDYIAPELSAKVFPQGVAAPPVPEGSAGPPGPQIAVDPFGLDPADAARMQSEAMQKQSEAMASMGGGGASADAGRGLPMGQPPPDAPPIATGGMQMAPTGAGGWGVG